MTSQDANSNKRIINITMNFELKNSELGKAYQEVVKNVTKDAIDAALTATNTIKNAKTKATPTVNKEMARLKRCLDYYEMKVNTENPNTSVTNTTESASFGAKMKTSKKERKATITVTDNVNVFETEAMKKVRLSLELKKLKKIQNDNSGATKSVVGIRKTCKNNITRAKRTKDSKADTRITNGDKDKPTIETEAMKRIRLSLELKKKSNLNNATATTSTTTSSPTSSSHQNVERTGNTKSHGKGIKRKVADTGTDKTHVDAEGMKKPKLNNSRHNENYPNTRTNEITNEQMDIDDEIVPHHRKKRATAATGTGSKRNTTQETKSVTEKIGVETEAMKMIRRRLEIKKTKNNNENTATRTSATSNTDTPTGANKDKQQLKSPKPVKRKTATVYNPTEEMKRIKALKEQREKSPTNTTSNAATANATLKKTNNTIKINHRHKYHKSDSTYNLTPNEITDDEGNENLGHEITDDSDDESDENVAVPKTNELNSEITNNGTKNDENKHENASRSSSRCRSAMIVDGPNDIAMTDTEITRGSYWERRVWK